MKINIPYQIYEKIMFWVDKADFEVSGFGKCLFDGKEFQVVSAVLLKQEGGAAHTDIDAESLSRVQYQLREEPGQLKFWWHSHVDMPTFMSGTDRDTIRELGANGWALASVFNKKHESTNAISYKFVTPYGEERTYYDDKLELVVTYPALTEIEKEEFSKQFTENVKRSVTPILNSFPEYGNGYSGVPTAYTPKSLADGDERDFETIFEKECAEAVGCTVKRFRKKFWAASQEQINLLSEEIALYWVTKRGYQPRDYTGDYDTMDLAIFEEDPHVTGDPAWDRYINENRGVGIQDA